MIKAIKLILLGILTFLGGKSFSQGVQPNILMIHTDDLGFHDLSVNGSKIYQTPHIDKLSEESVVFNKAYANYPRCVPSRYAMITGSYPYINGETPDDGFEVDGIPDEDNLVKILGNAQYQTAFFGKWHLGHNGSSPIGFGFDYSFAAGSAGSPISYIYPFNTPKGNNKKVKKSPIPDVDELGKEGDYLTDVMTDQVINYLSDMDDKKPFFIILSYYAVHQPIEAKEADIKRNRKEIASFDYGDQPAYIEEGTGRTKMRQDNAKYAAMVENLDMNVGKLLASLEEQGILENTIIVFSSDHGGLSNDGINRRNLATSNFPLRAGKGWMYEGGIKVPLFIKWQGTWEPKVDNESIVMLMDLLPTYVDLVGQNKSEKLAGESLLPLIAGVQVWDDRTVFWHTDKARPKSTGDTNSSVVRYGPWKLIDFYDEGRIELYNLDEDPYEHINLAVSHEEEKNKLIELLEKWKAK